MTLPLILPLVDEGLGNSAYLVDLGDGRALAVDPSRDLRELGRLCRQHGLRVAFTAETHLHADFVSGAVQLAADQQAEVLASAAGEREFPHRGLREGDEVDLGGLRLQVLATPGHTPEHLSYLLLDGSRPLAAFTGGSLIVGAAARTDLSGRDNAEALARAQYHSLHRLVRDLGDDTLVLPTHGAGSFCAAPQGADRTTTIGAERASNPLLAVSDEDSFVRRLLAGLGSYPTYFDRLGELNRRGPAPVDGRPTLRRLSVGEVQALEGEQIVDVRPVRDFAAASIPGSLSIQLRDAFATWLGWVGDPQRPIVVVRNDDQDPDEVVWQALKIGFDHLAGELAGGVHAWQQAGLATQSFPVVDAVDADPAQVLDVRQDSEYVAGHIPGARHAEVAELSNRVATGPVQTLCGHGERAATAASLLAALGQFDVTIVTGGPDDWAKAHGRSLAVDR